MSRKECARLLIACVCVTLASCTVKPEPEPAQQPDPEPEVRFVSNEEFLDVWNAADSRELVGSPAIRTVLDDEGTVHVTCNSVFRMSSGGGSSLGARCCEGRCKLNPGAQLADCKTSGCAPSDDTSSPSEGALGCSTFQCSGGCTVSADCRPCFFTGPIIIGRRPA